MSGRFMMARLAHVRKSEISSSLHLHTAIFNNHFFINFISLITRQNKSLNMQKCSRLTLARIQLYTTENTSDVVTLARHDVGQDD